MPTEFRACTNDNPANRPKVQGAWRCYNPGGTSPSGGVPGYPNLPDCSELGPAHHYERVPELDAYKDPGGCFLRANQLQFTCAKMPGVYSHDQKILLDCCLGRADEKGCAPGYCVGSKPCDTLLSGLCGDPRAAFAAGHEADCLSWCAANHGRCDTPAVEYCQRTEGGDTPAGKAFCACISAPGGAGVPPCFNAACISTGYHTKDATARATHCGDFCGAAVSCNQETNGHCHIDHNTFVINCGAGPPGGKPWAPLIPAGGGQPLTPLEPPIPAPRSVMMLVVVGLFLLLVVFALVLRARRSAAIARPPRSGATTPRGPG